MKSVPGSAPSNDRRKRSRILDAEVGQSIRHYRKQAKLTLQGLADRLGIAYQQVQKYETGVNRVGAGRLMEIAEILEVPVASFFDGAATAEGAHKSPEQSEIAAQGQQILAAFTKIKDAQKRLEALAFLKSLAGGGAP